jgi:hypothetical protein
MEALQHRHSSLEKTGVNRRARDWPADLSPRPDRRDYPGHRPHRRRLPMSRTIEAAIFLGLVLVLAGAGTCAAHAIAE